MSLPLPWIVAWVCAWLLAACRAVSDARDSGLESGVAESGAIAQPKPASRVLPVSDRPPPGANGSAGGGLDPAVWLRPAGGSLRTEDAFCRVGGEEFAVIMRDCTEDEAMQLAERLRRLVASTQFVYGGQQLPVTISLGVTGFNRQRHTRSTELVEEADRCLYEAKRSGRNRACRPSDLRAVPGV